MTEYLSDARLAEIEAVTLLKTLVEGFYHGDVEKCEPGFTNKMSSAYDYLRQKGLLDE